MRGLFGKLATIREYSLDIFHAHLLTENLLGYVKVIDREQARAATVMYLHTFQVKHNTRAAGKLNNSRHVILSSLHALYREVQLLQIILICHNL